MAFLPIRRGKTLIPRYSVPLYHRRVIKDVGNPFENIGTGMEFVCEEAKMCTLQSTGKNKFITDLSGLAVTEHFVMYTQTPVFEPIKGDNFVGSGVYIPDSYFNMSNSPFGVPVGVGGYYNAVEVYPHQNGVIPHYMVLLVKDSTAKDSEYPTKQKDASLPYMETLEAYKAGKWVATWVGK